MVGKDGICGIVCEHSASEGITVIRFCEQFLDYLQANPLQTSSCQRKDSYKSFQNSRITKNVHRLMWDIDNIISVSIHEAIKRVDKYEYTLYPYIQLYFT